MIDISKLTPKQKHQIKHQAWGLLQDTERELGISGGTASRVFNGKCNVRRVRALLERRITELIESGKVKIRLTVPQQADLQRTRTQA